jgi:hypothetical protein
VQCLVLIQEQICCVAKLDTESMAPKEYKIQDFEDYALEHCHDEYMWLKNHSDFFFLEI